MRSDTQERGALAWVISSALRLRLVVVAAALFLLAFGARQARRVPIDVFPEFAPPRIEIQTEAPGLSGGEVERLVSLPLEAELQGTPGLQHTRSKSVDGLSSVVLLLETGADEMSARQFVQERITLAASRLPTGAGTPVMLAPLSATSRVMKIGLTSEELSRTELSTLARWTIRPRLMAVPGVANVALWGQRDRELLVEVDPERLRRHGVALDAVVRAARDASDATTGGFVDTPNQRIAVRQVPALRGVDDLRAALVEPRGGTPLTLGDVAEVREGTRAPIGEGVVNDGPGILMIVEKEPTGNTLEVTRGVERALSELEPGLTGVTVDPTIFRPAGFIETAMENLSRALWVGCALVVLVLVVFLFDWRTALISVTAIPLSLLIAALVLARYGQTLNTMVLAGLVIALGEVVDDAIIDVENILRRLRLERERAEPRSAFRVVLAASLEVRSAVVVGSLVVVLVLLPVFFLDGLAGSFFRPLAAAYVLAIGASLLVALTVTPALSLMLLPGRAARRSEPGLVRALKHAYGRALQRLVARPGPSITGAALAAAASVLLAARLGEQFLPDFQERDFLMHFVERPGTSLDAMRRISERASRDLRAIPGVQSFGAHIGRAEVADEVVGANFTELWIHVDERVPYQPTIARVKEVIAAYPGLHRDVLTYLRERIKEVLTGAGATLVVRTFGPELDGLRAQADRIATALADVPGLGDLKVEQQTLVPRLDVRLRLDAAARHGLTASAVRRAVVTLVRGERVGEFQEGQAVFGVSVWGVAATRSDPTAVQDLLLDTPSGARVRLGEIADIALVPTPNQILREDGSRRIDVTCNVLGDDLGGIAREVERRLRGVDFERGYHAELLGEYAARQAARDRIRDLALVSLLGILLLLHADSGSFRWALIVSSALPFALMGGVLGAWLGGGVLSLGSMIGFVTVLGIAVRNAILLASHYRHLEHEEGLPFGRDLLVRGAVERLVPISMTALTAGLGLLPLVVAGNVPGAEIEYPLAIVILGGLVTSTALNLFVLPALFAAFGRSSRVREGA